jgi:cyclase
VLVETVSPSGVAIASLLHYDRTTIKDIKEYLNNGTILSQ